MLCHQRDQVFLSLAVTPMRLNISEGDHMKMKVAVLALLFLGLSQVSYADHHGSEGCGCPFKKAMRGVEGVLTFPLEYVNQYEALHQNNSAVASVIGSVFAGTAMSVKRVVNGVYDIVLFPVKAPGNYGLLLGDKYDTALDEYRGNQGSCSKK